MTFENEQVLIANVADMFAPNWQGKRKRWDFTVEPYRGRGKPTMYGHSTYERSSVLAGQPQRVFVWSFEDEIEAAEAVLVLQKHFGRKFRCEMLHHSTRIPDDILLSGIPDDTDY